MISPQRLQVILASLHGANPEERQAVLEYVHRSGLASWPASPARKAETFPTDYDHEAAILDRAAKD